MAGKQVILTQEGLEKLEQELEELKSVKRKEIAEKIKVALSFGDLSENSEYDEAKNEQAIMEARIADIEVTLKNVKVIDESELSNENIHIGSKVEVRVNNLRTGKTDVYNYKLSVPTKRTRFPAISPMSPPWARPCWATASATRSKWRFRQG